MVLGLPVSFYSSYAETGGFTSMKVARVDHVGCTGFPHQARYCVVSAVFLLELVKKLTVFSLDLNLV